MKPKLTSFFTSHPLEDSMKVALKMIKHNLHCALKALKAEEDDEYMKYLSEAHRMMEDIFKEIGKHPDNYKY